MLFGCKIKKIPNLMIINDYSFEKRLYFVSCKKEGDLWGEMVVRAQMVILYCNLLSLFNFIYGVIS